MLPAPKRGPHGKRANATITTPDLASPFSGALAIILAFASSGELGGTAPPAALLALWCAMALAVGLCRVRGFDVISWRSVLLPSSLERPG
jgi:hypothetical protein